MTRKLNVNPLIRDEFCDRTARHYWVTFCMALLPTGVQPEHQWTFNCLWRFLDAYIWDILNWAPASLGRVFYSNVLRAPEDRGSNRAHRRPSR